MEELPIEKEDLGSDIITKPYDPSDIRIDHQNVNLGFLLEKLEYDEIDLMPDFQREGNLWGEIQQSQLIESILLGLPLPSFYFSVNPGDGRWQVVDGLQRLSTFKKFWIDKSLKLKGLEFLDQYNNSDFNSLSRMELRKISGFKVNLYVIEKETPQEAKFLIFKRVNTGGLVLTPQEMRHALNQGKPAKFIKKLSKLEEFKKATDYRIPSKRQEDRDFVNRFIAFYILGFEENYKGELDTFLNEGMSKIKSLSDNELTELENAFKASMKYCYKIFNNDAFRKRYNYEDNRKPISKAIYDTVSVNIAKLSKQEKERLLLNKDEFRTSFINLLNEDSSFHRAVTSGTGQKTNVQIRFAKIKDLIDNLIKS
jgi:Protein of unknown function DUF262.